MAQRIGDRSGVGAEWLTSLTYANLDQAALLPSELMFEGWHGLTDALVLRGGLGLGIGNAIAVPRMRAIVSLSYQPTGERQVEPAVAGVQLVFVDQDGNAVPGASWTVADSSGQGDSSVELASGPYTVEASADGYKPATVDFTAPRGGSKTVEVELEAISGSLVVQAETETGEPVEGATWVLLATNDSFDAGEAQKLRPGTYEIRADAPGFRSIRREVTVVADTEETVVFAMTPSQADIKGDRITIKGSVYFETNKDVIKAESFPLLDEVAEILVKPPGA